VAKDIIPRSKYISDVVDATLPIIVLAENASKDEEAVASIRTNSRRALRSAIIHCMDHGLNVELRQTVKEDA
jgi:hypothetical protein